MPNDNIIKIIKANRGHYTQQQAKIANYLLAHRERAAFLTATQLAKEVGVSQPTVIRFAQAMGFARYSQFIATFQELLKQELTSTDRLNLSLDTKRPVSEGNLEIITQEIRTLENMVGAFPQKDFQKLVQAICNSHRVYITGTRGSASLAQYLAYFLGKVKRHVTPVATGGTYQYDQFLDLTSQDLVVGIAFPRYPRETLELVEFSAQQGAVTAGITDNADSPLARLVDLRVIIPITFATIFDSYSSTLCLFNMVVTEVGRANRAESEVIAQEFEKLAKKQSIFSPDQGIK